MAAHPGSMGLEVNNYITPLPCSFINQCDIFQSPKTLAQQLHDYCRGFFPLGFLL